MCRIRTPLLAGLWGSLFYGNPVSGVGVWHEKRNCEGTGHAPQSASTTRRVPVLFSIQGTEGKSSWALRRRL